MKTDKSIRNICIAAIKRRTIRPYEVFVFSRFFETEHFSELQSDIVKLVDISENELPIAQVIVDQQNWTLITTRQIVSCINGLIANAKADRALVFEDFGDFKGYEKKPFTKGKLIPGNHQELEVLIETGKASIIIIYATQTLIGQMRGVLDG